MESQGKPSFGKDRSLVRRPVTIRVPHAWQERLDSEAMTRWLEDFFSAPYLLPDDPGPGDARVCLSLPAKLIKAIGAQSA